VENLRLPLDGKKGITIAAACSRQVVYVPDIRQDPRYVSTGFPAISELAVPVMVGDCLLGVINVENAQPDAFDRTAREYLSILADQAALALENARMHAEARRRVEELALVNRIARQVNASLDLQSTLDAIVGAVAELVPCSLAEISLWDPDKEVLILQALRCDPERAFPLGQVYPPGEGYTGWVVRSKQPLLVPDVASRVDIHPALLPGELPFKAYLGLPLLCCEQLIGTLVLIHDQANTFGEKELRLLESLSEQAAAAIHNARLYKQLNGLYVETRRQAAC
jgi:GAF domain-containing protein